MQKRNRISLDKLRFCLNIKLPYLNVSSLIYMQKIFWIRIFYLSLIQYLRKQSEFLLSILTMFEKYRTYATISLVWNSEAKSRSWKENLISYIKYIYIYLCKNLILHFKEKIFHLLILFNACFKFAYVKTAFKQFLSFSLTDSIASKLYFQNLHYVEIIYQY